MFARWGLGSLAVALLAAEVVAFVLVVRAIGFAPALLVGVATGVIGVARLRRLGLAALAGLRSAARGQASDEAVVIDGALAALGAVLLVLPGFLTDLVGLALSAPSGRDWVKRRFRLDSTRGRGAQRPTVVDLDAGNWTRIDGMRPR